MKREIEKKLIEWKSSKWRKPLVFQGARQVGKTYTILQFGKEHYSNIAYFNFEVGDKLRALFNESMDPAYLLPHLERFSGEKIIPEQTLIVFDEIQVSERALTSLKYWNETHNQYHIIAAGSLLGVAINRSEFSFPVGKVDEVTMHPMSFGEFLFAHNEVNLLNEVKEHIKSLVKMPVIDHTALFEYYLQYLVVGGMPECVAKFIETENFLLVRAAQNAILHDYLADMSKYNTKVEIKRVHQVFNSATVQLSKKNARFQTKLISKNARASEFEKAIEWLELSGIITKVYAVEQGWKPLENYKNIDKYKIFVADTGLLCAMKDVDYNDVVYGLDELADFKGGLTENYVCNQLVAADLKPYYWESDRQAEVDFIVKMQEDNDKSKIVPIEVKSSDNTKSKSLSVYQNLFKPEVAIKLSAKNFGEVMQNNTKVKILPLYATPF